MLRLHPDVNLGYNISKWVTITLWRVEISWYVLNVSFNDVCFFGRFDVCFLFFVFLSLKKRADVGL